MEKKILPLADSLIGTYQGTAFVLDVLLAHENVKESYLNGYYNIQCYSRMSGKNLDVSFCNALWEDYRLSGIAEMDLFHARNIATDKFADFIRERIDQDNYILFYYIDVYYLPCSRFYHKKHDVHDIYIFGYEEDDFWALVYVDNRIRKLKVSIEDVCRGLYSLEEFVDFCSFRVNHKADVKADRKEIAHQIENYLSAGNDRAEQEMIYGTDVYKEILAYLKQISDDSPVSVKEGMTNVQRAERVIEDAIDIRPFRALYDHKQIVKDHLEALFQDSETGRALKEEAGRLEHMAKELLFKMIKYCMTGEKKLLEQTGNLVCRIAEEEKEMFGSVLRLL